MDAQFLHLDSAASVQRKARSRNGSVVDGKVRWSASDLLNEAYREPRACGHIDQPRRPVRMLGRRQDVESAGTAWRAETVVGNRRARKDAPWLVAGVVSLPRYKFEQWKPFRRAVVGWLQKKYGSRLRAVVAHLHDEANPHLHFYAVPHPRESFGEIHPGYAARAAAGKQGSSAAYMQAMRELQDDFHDQVGSKFGLRRLSEQRRRLSREEWRACAAQAAADTAAAKAEELEALEAELDGKEAELEKREDDLSRQREAVVKLIKEVQLHIQALKTTDPAHYKRVEDYLLAAKPEAKTAETIEPAQPSVGERTLRRPRPR